MGLLSLVSTSPSIGREGEDNVGSVWVFMVRSESVAGLPCDWCGTMATATTDVVLTIRSRKNDKPCLVLHGGVCARAFGVQIGQAGGELMPGVIPKLP